MMITLSIVAGLVILITSIPLLMCIAVNHNWQEEQCDVEQPVPIFVLLTPVLVAAVFTVVSLAVDLVTRR